MAVATDEEVFDVSEDVKVRTWRFDVLVDDVGLDQELAARLADSKVDLHRIEKMVKQGCSPELLERILL